MRSICSKFSFSFFVIHSFIIFIIYIHFVAVVVETAFLYVSLAVLELQFFLISFVFQSNF